MFNHSLCYFQPFFHFFVFFLCDGARGWCFDELGCEFDEFLVVNFADFRDDLCVRESWVCVAVVGVRAFHSFDSDRLELVSVADDVSDLGVVIAEDELEVEWCTCKDCFVFSAV